MKIPKLQTTWTTIPSDVTSSNWSVRLALQQAALQRQRRFVQALARLRQEDQRREDARRNQATVTADNRTTAKRNQDLQQTAVKTTLIRKEQEKANNLQRFGQVADAAIKLTRPSTYMGYALTDKPFGEGFGNETANIAGDLLAAPLASIGKQGFKYVSDVIPRVARFGVSNHTGNWTRFGNNMYRLKPGYIGMNGVQIERRATITPEDLANRKFFPVEEYGSEPIYTRETVPKKIEVKMAYDDVNPTLYDDITYMNENFDGKTMSTMQVARNRLKLWKESPHGRAINFGGDTDLSTSSWPQTLKFNMNRHLDGTGTAYIPDNYGTTESFLNNAGELPINQETVDYFNSLIKEFNLKTGLNLSNARFVPESVKQLPAGRVLRTPARIYVPNLGLIKHKHGAKIMPNR